VRAVPLADPACVGLVTRALMAWRLL